MFNPDQTQIKYYEEIIRGLIRNQPRNFRDFEKIERSLAKKNKKVIPRKIILNQVYHKMVREKRIKPNQLIEDLLITRQVRSRSGVAVVAVLTKPYPCPGKCIYCPDQAHVPKSYLENEPAVMRAIKNNYDPFSQVISRLQSLKMAGHKPSKIELIVIGGTWSFLPRSYQKHFIKRCFEATNGRRSLSLKAAQRKNEKVDHRIIGITLETRPDYITPEEVKRMRRLGATRVEIGVQSLDDQILKLNQRGHGVAATIRATQLLKDAGIKVGYHLMPNLPGSTPEKDYQVFKQVFADSRFRPDLLKIYPTAITKEAPLYQLWKKGNYKAYSKKVLISLLKKMKKDVPFYCRIQRVIRDIPSSSIVTGPTKISNLREVILKELKKEGASCRCIRCREIRENYDEREEIKLYRLDYQASQGKEIFLSYENLPRTHLYSLLRLRIPSSTFSSRSHFIPILQDAAIIRQVHTYGLQLPFSQKNKKSPQHRGLGKKLIYQAEEIARNEFPGKIKKIAVISGIGVRGYYRKLGYKLRKTYMIKPVS
jgi:elongator complex protein 3